MARPGWRGIERFARQVPMTEINKQDLMATFPTGGWVQVRSADDPQSLRGEGLDFVVLDECAYMRREAWAESLRPALTERKGRALFISTPKGHNWFWQLWSRGQDATEENWQSWQRPSRENPFLDEAEIEQARTELPERTYLQEYEAQFTDDAGMVFRHVLERSKGRPLDGPRGTRSYVAGVDWGKSEDFTVVSVFDAASKRQVYIDRFNQIDYVFQSARLKALHERWHFTDIVAETNAMGDPIVERLQRDGLPVTGYTTTHRSKTDMIEALALALERGDVSLLDDQTQIAELQAYTFKRLPGGGFRYSAPDGLHDDTVMALALAYSAVRDYGPAIYAIGV